MFQFSKEKRWKSICKTGNKWKHIYKVLPSGYWNDLLTLSLTELEIHDYICSMETKSEQKYTKNPAAEVKLQSVPKDDSLKKIKKKKPFANIALHTPALC